MIAIDMPPAPGSIALVDLGYLFKKRYVTIGNETPMAAAKATLKDLEWLSGGVDHLIVCRDAAPYKRQAVYEAYKANRPAPEMEERAQKKWLFEQLRNSSFNVAWVDGYEADDVIASLAARYSAWCTDVRIVGSDKDMAQCLNDNVKQYIPPHGETDWVVRDVAAAAEKFGVPPQLMTFFQGLVGDKEDNIPGVLGIGKVHGAALANKYKTPMGLATALAAEPSSFKPAIVKALAEQWDKLTLSVQLATLDTSLALDFDGLLVKRTPQPVASPAPNSMEPKPSNDYAEALEEATKLYQQKFQPTTTASATEAEYVDEQNERERRENEEHVDQPAPKAPEAAPTRAQLALLPSYSESKYGLVTKDLQPLDLKAARVVSEWLCDGGMYPQFETPTQIFSVIARGKELGIGMTTALAGHHIVEGRVVASADLIRALCERDATFEYLMPTEISATRVTWRGKRKGQPTHVDFTYTIEDAQAAGLVKLSKYGKPGNWMTRPQDMLMKTAGSKLARILWPAATLGLYCPEEMGYSQEDMEQAA